MIVRSLVLLGLMASIAFGQLSFGPGQTVVGAPTVFSDESVEFFDVDGDGDLDVVGFGVNPSNSMLVLGWSEFVGGNYGIFHPIGEVDDPRDIAIEDFDGDGDPDFAIADEDDQEIIWYENLAGGLIFAFRQVIGSGIVGLNLMKALDADGDGDVDLVASRTSPNSILYFENLGNGFFASAQTLGTLFSSAFVLEAADTDGDGDEEIIFVTNQTTISQYENLGRSFSSAQPLGTSPQNVRRIRFGDIDGDQDLDLVVSASGSTGSVYWRENDGAGSFGPVNTVASGFFIALALDDLDLDGDLDILADGPFATTLDWYENIGSGFASAQTIAAPMSLSRIRTGDADGDGDRDVLASTSALQTGVAWFENITPLPLLFPGSGDDLVLESGINAAVSRFPAQKSAAGGDAINLRLASPGGTFVGTEPLLFAQVYSDTATVLNPGGFPEAWVNPVFAGTAPIVTLYGSAAAIFGPGILPPAGLSLAVTAPPGLGSSKVIVQGFVLAPSSVTGNPLLTATDAHEIDLTP
jgi:FG-GAP-like repeat